MSTPSTAEFYSSIATFLQCLNLTTKFEGQVPNEFQIITHAKDNDGGFIRYTYNPSEKNVTDEKLDLVDRQTGLENYRFHLALEEDKLLTGVSGSKAEKICPVFNKAFEERYCAAQTFSEILGLDLVSIGCQVPYVTSFKLNGTKLTGYAHETENQFNCESKLAVFGDKIVFKNKGEDVCKEINWAVDHVWKASECAKDDKFKLNSKNVLLFPLDYILIKFSVEGCQQPGPEVTDYLNNTYINYLYNPNRRSSSENVTMATIQAESPNWALIGGGIGGALVFLLLLTGLAIFLIRLYKKRQYRRHPARHVRYDFSTGTGMQTPKECEGRYRLVKLKSGRRLQVPTIIDNVEVKRMVAEGQFGAFYEYQYKGTSYWYKLEANLGPKYKQPLACESGVYQLLDQLPKLPDKAYIGSMLSCCHFSEGVYCMRVENYGPNVREMRQGQLMALNEAQKLFFQLLYCTKALIKYGICHRYIKESAFYVKKDRDTYRFVITDLGYAIRIGSERSAFYPIPETATTHIHAKKALKVEDSESLLFMILRMMVPLPWEGVKNIEEARKIKLECTEEGIPDEFNTKEAITLCHMRGLYTDDLALENVAEMMILYYLAVEPSDDLHLPVHFPNAEFKLAGTFKSYD
ncbi:unnamed protein product [Bursaphelenchus xylophilus]|nr:unnamed protein product [Bursaphelenchus xylophilus]CAG9102465.1 unnamed protein product [Bursaphelenchus xylophilus]